MPMVYISLSPGVGMSADAARRSACATMDSKSDIGEMPQPFPYFNSSATFATPALAHASSCS
jgi:hypothetical protein